MDEVNSLERLTIPNIPGDASLYHCVSCLARSAKYRTDLEDLVNFTAAREERSEGVELCHNAAYCPHVNRRVVVGGVQKHLRSSVPAASDKSMASSKYANLNQLMDVCVCTVQVLPCHH